MKNADDGAELRASGGAVVRREPLTYERHKPVSWVVDQARADLLDDQEARARLARHAREVDVELRANPSTTLGIGGEFAPPLWVIGAFSTSPSGGRVLADLIDAAGNLFPLPAGVSSVNVPRIAVSSLEAVQPGQGAADPSADPTSANAQGAGQVTTISGDIVLSQQLLDQTPVPGADQVWLADLMSNYNEALDNQMLTGTGTNGQLLGVANVTSANTVSGATGTTFTLLSPLVGRMLAAVGNTRFLPVTDLIMAPRRWAWIASSLDSSNRPLVEPGEDCCPSAFGLPVAQAGSILSQGTAVNTAADVIYGVRPADLMLWESSSKVLVAANPTSGALQVRVRLARYVAFVSNRYPTGIGVVSAIPAPTNF